MSFGKLWGDFLEGIGLIEANHNNQIVSPFRKGAHGRLVGRVIGTFHISDFKF